MASANRIVALAFAVSLSSISATLLAHPSQTTGPFDSTAPENSTDGLVADGVAHLRVSVCDHTHAEAAAIGLGEAIAAAVYQRTGVAIDWTNGCQYDAPSDFHINPLPQRMTPRALRALNVFGFAAAGQSVANVMWERIDAAAINHRIASGHLLGFVIAHELGHLLLPPKAHRWSSVMQRDIDFRAAAVHDLWFNREQAALILRKVQSIADHRRDSMSVASN